MKRTWWAVAGLAVLTGSGSAAAAPCEGFTDVEDTNAFCGSIAWMKNRGITLGCTSTTLYCPDQFVRRDQMAAFMYRLGFQNAFLSGGNAFGATATLGTTDDQWLEVVVNGARVMSYRPNVTSPMIVGGHSNNLALAAPGGFVAGGGAAGADCYDIATFTETRTCGNAVIAQYAAVGGGKSNIAFGEAAVVAGGTGNTASGGWSTVGGGVYNQATALWATVMGGQRNHAAGQSSAVLGGLDNRTIGYNSLAAGNHAVATLPECMV
ncbi:MAG: hypothetical protein KJ018_08105, partial [Burkholderiales bacterium]|nr:hypothetical protein [Burkholderiales bacterium]